MNKKKFGLCLLFAFLSEIALNLSLATISTKNIIADSGVAQPHAFFRLLWDFKMSLSGYSTETIIVFVALALLFYVILKYENRFCLSALVTSALFAFFQVFGTSFKATASWEYIFGGARNFIKASVSFVGYGVLFYFAICGIFILFRKVKFVKSDTVVRSWFTDNRKSLFIVAGLILLMWLPYLIVSFPGLTNYDFFDMLNMFYGRDTTSLRVVVPIDPSVTLNNNNPVCQTLMAVGFIKLGNLLGSPYIGLFLFVSIQAVLFALVLSHVIRYLARRNINKPIRIILLLMYGLIPLHSNFAFTTLKDTNFSFVTLLYLLLLIDLVLNPKDFVNNKFNLLKLGVLSLLMMFLRNNGLYIVALSAVIFLVAYRKHIKKLLAPLMAPVIIFLLVTNVLYPALKISPGSAAEAYSIPFQQVARLVKEHGDELTQEEKETFSGLLWYSVLAERYNPELSDPVKSTYKLNHTDEQFKEFFDLWFKYLLKYPGLYVQATMSNCYGYFYPEAESWLVYNGIAPPGADYGLTNIESLNTIRIELVQMSYVFRNIPVLGLFESIGFYVWGLFCVAAALIRYRNKKYIMMMVPMFVLLLTAIAGPANTMMRYVYPIILSTPIFVIMAGYIITNKKEDTTTDNNFIN